MKSVKATIKVSEQRIVDMFITACEGGSNYWCGKVDPLGRHKDAYRAMLGGFKVFDNEEQREFVVQKEDVVAAVQLMAETEPKHFADMMSENDDASTGDVFLQLCCFREVIYG